MQTLGTNINFGRVTDTTVTLAAHARRRGLNLWQVVESTRTLGSEFSLKKWLQSWNVHIHVHVILDIGSGRGDIPLCSNTSHYVNSVHQYRCEARSGSEHECFWNPVSRVTGEFCNTCHESCQSKRKAMDFYQFSIGVLIISLASPLGFVYVAAITSDITPVESQVINTCTHILHGTKFQGENIFRRLAANCEILACKNACTV